MPERKCPHCGELVSYVFWNARLAVQCGEEGEAEKALIQSLTGCGGKSRERALILLAEVERREGNETLDDCTISKET